MAATMITASTTTASLSDAKNSKTGLRCHAGCPDELVFAMPERHLPRGKCPLQGAPLPALAEGSTRPGFPAFANRFGITLHVDLPQPFHAAAHGVGDRVSRTFILFPERFEKRPEKGQRKNAPIQLFPGRFRRDLRLAFAARSIANCQANGDPHAKCAENGRHRVFAH